MKILDIRQTSVPISSPMKNAYIDFSKMDVSVVAVVTDVQRDGRQVIGYGFNSNGRYAPTGLLRERFIPRLLHADPRSLLSDEKDNLDPHRIWTTLMTGEKPGGHGERSVAVGVLDMAVWDAVAKIAGKPLWRLLADRYRNGEADTRVWVYAAGGYYEPGKDLRALQDEMRGYLAMGYTTVKMKIGGEPLAEDIKRIEAVLEVVDGDGSRLAVDANGRFDLDTALAYAEALAPYGLHWYEEAGDPLDYDLQARLGEVYPNTLATGENLFSMQDARNLIRYGGMRSDRDVLQFDCALSYGLVEYLRTLEMMEEHGWSRRMVVPHGGHQLSLNMAAGLGLGGNESYPGVFQPFGGFADTIPVVDGYVALPDTPGIGFEEKANLWAVMRELAEQWGGDRNNSPDDA
ncbi:MAG: mandelate racemase/muconate lactonizing enzyme family protein, partial [Chloroflexia bacterium]|nr:mandelate racemase/muconate lactonizing enzyme family protein [Chloroflexia bacterium]